MEQMIELNGEVVATIRPTVPFSFDGTFHKPSHFPTPDNSYEPGVYYQTMCFNGETYGLKFVNEGNVDDPKITLFIYFAKSRESAMNLEAITAELKQRFDLENDLSDFVNILSKDRTIGTSITRWRGMRVSTPYSLYEFLIVTTVLQNTTVHRTVQMIDNLFQEFGTLVRYNGKILYAFWPPALVEATSEEKLRALKVGYRAKTFKRQAAEFSRGSIDEQGLRRLSKGELKTKLLEIYGVGPATVQYLLFEVFHHYDACEHISPWERKIYSRLLFDKEEVDGDVVLEEITRRWGQWRMLAMHYLFENLFWHRKRENIDWLEALIRL